MKSAIYIWNGFIYLTQNEIVCSKKLIKPAKINKQAGDFLSMLKSIEVFETRLLSAM